ncbi:MAG: hypothetical protein H0X66_17910 [Verrucomicrobia bacterium]|nr:hypothetical protein [Verrucomicrobiota bacterium]
MKKTKAPAAKKQTKAPAKKAPTATKVVAPKKAAPKKAANKELPSVSKATTRTQLTKGNARVTKNKITQSGLTTRVRGHVSARGKRAQARRNVR